MGYRGNIAIVQSNNDQVWLYSHWGGSELPQQLKKAMHKAEPRWTDESYCAKIIIGNCVPAKNWNEETGYGISCRLQDNEYPINVVDLNRQIVYTMPESALEDGKVPANYKPDKAKTFEEFIS